MSDQIQVSVICLAYNHEKYIRQCLDGFVMQKDVTFEVIIHDDASTDKTADIIREYEKKYPDIFKPIYQTENQYSKHINIIKEYIVQNIKGKYVAICEGDDYWTDPYKLKKQYDALEANPDCYICFHDVEIASADGDPTGNHLPYCKINTGKMTSDQFYQTYKDSRYFHTTSFFVNSEKYIDYRSNPPVFRQVAPVGDEPAILYFSYIGNVYYIDDTMSHYRFMSTGSWSSSFHTNGERAWRIRENHIDKMKAMMDRFFDFSGNKYNKELSFKIDEIYRMDKLLSDDKYWYCIENKNYKLLFKEFSIDELKKYDLSNKAILKLKLLSVFCRSKTPERI